MLSNLSLFCDLFFFCTLKTKNLDISLTKQHEHLQCRFICALWQILVMVLV